MKGTLCVFLLIAWSSRSTLSSELDYKLEQIQLVFRHGDRVPNQKEIYPADPYKEMYRSLGFKQLTKAGKKREFEIGQALRQRFGSFLGNLNSSDVFAYTTDADRTKESLKLALTGLTSPLGTQWSKNISLTSFPTYFETSDKNFLTGFTCPEYIKLKKEAEKDPEIFERLKKYHCFNEYVRNKTEIASDWPFISMPVYHNVHAALSMGLPLPKWLSREDLEKLEEITAIFFDVQAHTDAMNRFVVGLMAEQFLENMENEHSRHGNRKIYLYCAHDMNIGSFTRVHNFTEAPAIPDYGSTIVLEKLRGSDDQIYIRFSMWLATTKEWIPLKLDVCGEVCTIAEYKKFIKPILPDEAVNSCRGEREIYN